MTDMITFFSACQIQEKQSKKSFRVSDSEVSETSEASEDSAIEVKDDLLAYEDTNEADKDSDPLLQRSMKLKSYHNPITNAEIVIDESKELFSKSSKSSKVRLCLFTVTMKNEFENS